jgi:hypothetical protein
MGSKMRAQGMVIKLFFIVGLKRYQRELKLGVDISVKKQ